MQVWPSIYEEKNCISSKQNKISIYVLDLCIIKGNKVKFQEYARDKKNVKKISNPLEKVIFPETFLCISYNTQIEYIGSFIPHD